MKFRDACSNFWRQRGSCCLFVEVLHIFSDDGKTAEMRVKWCSQLNNGWRTIGIENIRVSERDYPLWMGYVPRGEHLHGLH